MQTFDFVILRVQIQNNYKVLNVYFQIRIFFLLVCACTIYPASLSQENESIKDESSDLLALATGHHGKHHHHGGKYGSHGHKNYGGNHGDHE